MPTNHPDIPFYSASDLLRYATGQMTAPEMHVIEKAALEDPFLAEALEGYLEARAHPQLQTSMDKLTPAAKEKEKHKVVPVWRKKILQYAAAAAIVLGGGWFTYSLMNPARNEQQTIAGTSEKLPAETASSDTVAMNSPATSSVPVQQAPAFTEQEQYANSNPAKPIDDHKLSKPSQEPVLLSSKATIVQDSIVKEKADHTDVMTDELAKKEMKDAPSPVTVTNNAPVENEASANDKIALNQRSTALNKSSNKSEALSRNVFRGRITDAKNNPLPYANVMISGENIGTYTDTKGNFNITYDDSVVPVRTRSLGYESQTVQLKSGNREQQIIMPEDEKLKESLSVVMQKPQAKQAGLKPLIVETDSLSSAQPVVGLIDYNTYLLNNNRISELPKASRFVELSFEVDKRGEVKNITVEQSSGNELDAEAIRLLKEGPKWKSNKGGTGRARMKVKL